MVSLPPLIVLPPPPLPPPPQEAAPNASAQTPAMAKTERGLNENPPSRYVSGVTADAISPGAFARNDLLGPVRVRARSGGDRRRVDHAPLDTPQTSATWRRLRGRWSTDPRRSHSD